MFICIWRIVRLVCTYSSVYLCGGGFGFGFGHVEFRNKDFFFSFFLVSSIFFFCFSFSIIFFPPSPPALSLFLSFSLSLFFTKKEKFQLPQSTQSIIVTNQPNPHPQHPPSSRSAPPLSPTTYAANPPRRPSP